MCAQHNHRRGSRRGGTGRGTRRQQRAAAARSGRAGDARTAAVRCRDSGNRAAAKRLRERAMRAVEELSPAVVTSVACEAIGRPRATVYRHRSPEATDTPRPRVAPPLALSREQRRQVLDGRHRCAGPCAGTRALPSPGNGSTMVHRGRSRLPRQSGSTRLRTGRTSAHWSYPATVNLFRRCLKVIDTFRNKPENRWIAHEKGSLNGGLPARTRMFSAWAARLWTRARRGRSCSRDAVESLGQGGFSTVGITRESSGADSGQDSSSRRNEAGDFIRESAWEKSAEAFCST